MKPLIVAVVIVVLGVLGHGSWKGEDSVYFAIGITIFAALGAGVTWLITRKKQ